jgi:hypothetical protein
LDPVDATNDIEERTLPPSRSAPWGPMIPQQPYASSVQSDGEEYAIVEDRTYYIKISAGENRHVLEKEVASLKQKFPELLQEKSCSVKTVSNAAGEQREAILIGPYRTQAKAIEEAQKLETKCSVISVKKE